MPKIPCFLCGKQLQRRIDKNRKPYFVCDPCGTQIFVRRPQGIENLRELMETLKGRDLPFREHARVLHEIQAALIEMKGLNEEIKSLDSVFDFFWNDKDKTRARRALRVRIDNLLSQLDQIASQKRPQKKI